MTEKMKKITGLMLAIVMIGSMFPFSAASADTEIYTSNVIGPLVSEETEEDFGEPDPTADLETEEDFVASLKDIKLKGLPYNERLLAVAETQLGYSESESNFIVKENEAGKKEKVGYTRYGAWYGAGFEYESWCAMFISFCLHYAEVPEKLMPIDSGVITWIHKLQTMELYQAGREYLPKGGDFVFFDFDHDGYGDHMGIVTSVFWEDGVEMIGTIEGNHSTTVETFSYPRQSLEIMGYGVMSSELPEDEQEKQIFADYHSVDGNTYRVTMTYTPDAGIPDGSVVIVREILPSTGDYANYVAETEGALGWEEGSASEAIVLDISVYADGVEVQPAAPVSVELSLLAEGEEAWNVVHFGEEAPQVLESTSEGDTVTFETEGFSIFVFAKAVIEKTLDASDGNTYKITVTYDSSADIPEGAQLDVAEITEDSPEYQEYVSKSENAVGVEEGKSAFVRLFDIKILDKSGEKIEISAPVDVKIELMETGSEKSTSAADTQVVHFADDSETGNVLENVEVAGSEEAEEGVVVSFETEGFSIFAVIGTITTQYITADGETYNITVTYDKSAGIPDGARLDVAEITEDSPEYQEYVSKSENAVGVEEGKSAFVRLFDIKILDKNGEKIEISAPVDVKIELMETGSEKSTSAADTQVVHFADNSETGDVLENVEAAGSEKTEEGVVVSFKTEGFSIFAVIGTITTQYITADGETYNITVTYDKSAGIPDGAGLAVTEILEEENEDSDILSAYDEYLSKTEEVLDINQRVKFARFFDISIVADGEEVHPLTPVEVRIELAEELRDEVRAVHFVQSEESDETKAVLLDAELTETEALESAVSFHAEGFSVYGIVVLQDLSELDGSTYGLINTKDGSNPSGIAMMTTAQDNGKKLQGKSTTVRVNTVNRTDYVYVAKDSNITMWTFHNVSGGYYISTNVNGSIKYLKLSSGGVSLADTPDNDCVFTVTAGTGAYAGKYKFSTNNGTLRLNGSNFEKAAKTFNNADAWMNFADLSELNEDDFVTYTAQKVSISKAAGEVNDGDMVVVYTRIWNDDTHKYDFYAVDYDGKLVKAYESGDTISWVGSQVNTMLWNFTEYYYAGTNKPNGYYELQNYYSGNYIAPKTSNGSDTFLSNGTIGINMNGRGEGDYFTTILAWDGYYYASLKVDEENTKLLSSTMLQASDFYFAKMATETSTMEVTTVSTVDSTEHGITLKMQDFGENDNLTGGRSKEMDNILGNTSYVQWEGTKNLLKNYIEEGESYPEATYSHKTLDKLFSNPMEVNQAFLTNTYYETGYFEYDSTRNFAHLITSEKDPWFGLEAPNGKNYEVGDFVVYGQLGTSDEGNKDTLRHGQFFPYNDIINGFETDEEGNYILDENGNPIPIAKKISKKYANTMDIHADPLSSLDPAYGEALYEITYKNTHKLPYVDHFFGMEMSASFMQSANGLDAWGHDLIFEFSGDDDFWLYVDDVLVLDLGGIHSALDGSVNFRTGRIVENGTEYWLNERFEAAYRQQHAGEADLETNLQNWLKKIFKVETVVEGGVETERITPVFKDYSSHTMRMFYLERGAGASNIHMRFNLSEYKQGRVQLEKIVSGTENSRDDFPFQIWYKDPNTHEFIRADNNIEVVDSRTGDPVPYKASYDVSSGENELTYENVFLLKAGQTVNIGLPDEDTEYYIRECAMDSPATYEWVKINDVQTAGSPVAPQKYNDNPVTGDTSISEPDLLDFNTTKASVSERKKVIYENHMDENAMHNLTIIKRLWQDEDRNTAIYSGTEAEADNTEFAFRVYIGKENGQYTIYKNGPYRVKNPAGEYCYYNDGFVSTGKTVFSEITDDIVHNDPQILLGDTLQDRCTFHTGRGSVSKIKAGYIVEIPGLTNGTPFIVVERDDETPSGYNRLGYELDNTGTVLPGSILTETTEDKEVSLLLEGAINGDKTVTVHNQHGYTLIVNKVWSDAAFMVDHDEIYFAVYLKDGESLSLIEDSVRQLGKTSTSLNWFFPELEEGKNLNDYEVYEVVLNIPDGSVIEVDSSGKVTGYKTAGSEVLNPIQSVNVKKIEQGGTLTAGGTSNEHGYSASMDYVAGYSREVLTEGTDGKYPNIRTDTVTNARAGIKLLKTDLKGSPLEGAGFEFKDDEGKLEKTFTSDKDGLIVVAYLTPDKEYTLTEIAAPFGYKALIDEVTIKVGSDGRVYVNDSYVNPENGYYIITQVENPTPENMPSVTIRNKDFSLKAVKIDSYTGYPMKDVKFALYKEVLASTNGVPDPSRPMPDYTPMEGYDSDSLITDSDGIIPRIVLKNSENPDGLTAGNYYLREIETHSGYISLGVDIRILISATGEVTLQSATRPTQPGQDWTFDDISSDIAKIEQGDDGVLQITVKNTPKDPIRIKKMQTGNTDLLLAGVEFKLYKSDQIENGLPKQGEIPLVCDTTDSNGILNLGGLDGLYYLFETQTLDGYNLLPGPIIIIASAGDNTITATLNGESLVIRKTKDSDGKDVWEISVFNSPGIVLPKTGGFGTEIFASVGGAMSALAGMLLVLRKKKRFRSS